MINRWLIELYKQINTNVISFFLELHRFFLITQCRQLTFKDAFIYKRQLVYISFVYSREICYNIHSDEVAFFYCNTYSVAPISVATFSVTTYSVATFSIATYSVVTYSVATYILCCHILCCHILCCHILCCHILCCHILCCRCFCYPPHCVFSIQSRE